MKNATFNRLALAPLALLLAGGASALQAQDSSMRFGAGLQLVNPMGESADTDTTGKLGDYAKMGFGLTLLGEMGLADRHALRGRAEYHSFGEKSEHGWKNNASAITVFADYIFRFESHDTGLYAFGGLGMVNGTIKSESYGYSESESGSGLGFSAGLGYNFSRNMGAEAQYVTASGLEFGDNDYKIDFNWIQVSFKYRF
jgi:opacity protein-like surface antigen